MLDVYPSHLHIVISHTWKDGPKKERQKKKYDEGQWAQDCATALCKAGLFYTRSLWTWCVPLNTLFSFFCKGTLQHLQWPKPAGRWDRERPGWELSSEESRSAPLIYATQPSRCHELCFDFNKLLLNLAGDSDLWTSKFRSSLWRKRPSCLSADGKSQQKCSERTHFYVQPTVCLLGQWPQHQASLRSTQRYFDKQIRLHSVTLDLTTNHKARLKKHHTKPNMVE